MSDMFAEPDLDNHAARAPRLRSAKHRNPDKLFPTPRLCGERSRGAYVPHHLETSGIAEIF